jgi:hypothetical protein
MQPIKQLWKERAKEEGSFTSFYLVKENDEDQAILVRNQKRKFQDLEIEIPERRVPSTFEIEYEAMQRDYVDSLIREEENYSQEYVQSKKEECHDMFLENPYLEKGK